MGGWKGVEEAPKRLPINDGYVKLSSESLPSPSPAPAPPTKVAAKRTGPKLSTSRRLDAQALVVGLVV